MVRISSTEPCSFPASGTVVTRVASPEKLHSDQDRNFKSYILSELCKAFRITKSRTTPYHPMGDGLVERMNRTLLNLLRTYTEGHGDWEEHLQLLLFAYRTTKHSSTELSPHEVLFGYNPPPYLFLLQTCQNQWILQNTALCCARNSWS